MFFDPYSKIIDSTELSVTEQWPDLRVRTFSHQTFRDYHVYCNFILGYICWIAVNFGTLKYESLLNNKHLLWNYKWNFRLSMSAFSTVTRYIFLEQQFFTRNFTFKLLHISIAVTVANSLRSKYYLQFLTNYFTTSWQNLNKIRWSELNLDISDTKKTWMLC